MLSLGTREVTPQQSQQWKHTNKYTNKMYFIHNNYLYHNIYIFNVVKPSKEFGV